MATLWTTHWETTFPTHVRFERAADAASDDPDVVVLERGWPPYQQRLDLRDLVAVTLEETSQAPGACWWITYQPRGDVAWGHALDALSAEALYVALSTRVDERPAELPLERATRLKLNLLRWQRMVAYVSALVIDLSLLRLAVGA